MGINIITGKSRIGKTTYIFNQIKNNSKDRLNTIKSYVVVPEQFALTTEEKLCDYLDNGLINVEVLTFKRMSNRVFNELGIKPDYISDVGKKIILYNILNDNKYKLFSKQNKGNIEKILDVFSEFDRYRILDSDITNLVFDDIYFKKKIEDLINIYSDYKKEINDIKVDGNSQLDILEQYIGVSNMLKNANIFIDEFFGFTIQEYNIIKSLSVNNNVYISFCIDSENIIVDKFDIYQINKKTYSSFISNLKKDGIEIKSKIDLNSCSYPIKNINNELVHLQNNIFSYPYKKYEDKTNRIDIFSCINPFVEIENLAQNIIKNIREGYRFSNITVITRDLNKYVDLIYEIFEKYSIPYFIDYKKEVSKNQISILMFSILDMLVSNFSYESVFAYLKTGFLDVDIDDIHMLENYVIKWNIKGYKWYEEFKYTDKNKKDEGHIEKLNNIRKKIIFPLIELKTKLSNKNSVNNIIKEIYSFLDKNGLQNSIDTLINSLREKGLKQLEKEYIDIWNYYKDIFNELTISLGSSILTISEFKTIFEISITDTQRTFIPVTKDCVLIGDIERTRTNEVEILYFIGTQNGQFPISYTNEGILSDKQRTFLANNNITLAKTTQDKILEDEFNIYKIITMVKQKIYFSFIVNDLEGISYRPSFVINKIKKVFNLHEKIIDNNNKEYSYPYNINVNFDCMFNIKEYIKWYENFDFKLYNKYTNIIKYKYYTNVCLSKDSINLLYGDKFEASISKLEEYVRCPYGFYLKYGLKVKERDIYKIRSIDIGSFNHSVLDVFFKNIINDRIDFSDINDDEIYKMVSNIIDEQLNNVNTTTLRENKNFNVLKIKLKRVIFKSVLILINQIKKSSFKPIATEVEFGGEKDYHKIIIELSNTKTVELVGKIDRIDLADTKDGRFIRIIDYKSSNKSLDINDIYCGLNLQLITYLNAISEKEDNIVPGGILYFKIDDPLIKNNQNISDEQIFKEVSKKLKLNGLILNDRNLIKHMDNCIDKNSDLVNIKVNEDGLSSNNNAIDYDTFIKLQKYSKTILKKISESIFSGDINIKPYYKNKNERGCMYCKFNPICKFNSKNTICRYNLISKIDRDEILKCIGEKIQEN